MLDESLTWIDQTNMVANNSSSITGVLYRLKSVFSKINIANILQYTYWVIHKLWINGLRSEIQQNRSATEKSHKTNSTYFAHTTPLFKSEGLLKVYDIFKLKFLKFFYKLSYDLLPPYFNCYHDVIDKELHRVLRLHFIHQPHYDSIC